MSMMPSGMQNMDLNALVRMFSSPNNQGIPGNTYQGVTYDANHPYVTSGYIANNQREAKFKDEMGKLRQETGRAAQTLMATNKKNPKYWSESTGLPRADINSVMGLLGNNAGLSPGRLQGGDRYYVDLLPYADRYNQLLKDYRGAGGTNRNYGQSGY